MSLLKSFDSTSNFWKLHPQFKTMEPFLGFYKADKSREKKDSSTIMWGIAFLTDPSSHNIWRNIPIDERPDKIAKDFFKKPNFKWEKYTEQVEAYKRNVLSQASKSLLLWEEIMNDRGKTLKAMYKTALKNKNIEEITKLDKLLASTPSYYVDYEKIRTSFIEEEDKIARGAGNKPKSLSDSKEL